MCLLRLCVQVLGVKPDNLIFVRAPETFDDVISLCLMM
jgi:hypothetical protein